MLTPIAAGALASLAAGVLTAVGAAPVLLRRQVPARVSDTMLGFAAGVMLAASFLSLIIPGLGWAEVQYGPGFGAALVITAGVLAGGAFVAILNEVIPHEHFQQGREGPARAEIDRVWLFVAAITIHNLPEGMAVGVGFGGGDYASGAMLALGIGLQNAPEGLAVGLALRAAGYGPGKAFLVAAATGMVEPVSGTIGAWGVSLSQVLLPWAMSFAAGAMIYVISHEIIPDTHRHGAQNQATFGLMIGLGLMMLLDMAFA